MFRYRLQPQSRWSRQLLILQSGLNARRQSAEVSNTLQFVVGQLDFEMLLKPGKQIERLQAVDSQGLKEIVVRRKLSPRHFEMRGCEVQHFFNSLISSGHNKSLA